MKFKLKEDGVHVTLSERNLRAGLHKLVMDKSARTLFTDETDWSYEGEHSERFWLHFETDEEHYGNREFPPGPMHPNTEKYITEIDRLKEEIDLMLCEIDGIEVGFENGCKEAAIMVGKRALGLT